MSDLDILPCPFCVDRHGHISQDKRAYYRQCDCGARGPASERHGDRHDERAYDRAIYLWNRRVVTGHPMYMAPRDGSAFLATGTHDRDDPPGAAHGVKAGDRWWSILLFDVWREPHRFVFAKDGALPWSEPQRWCPLPELLAGDAASVRPPIMAADDMIVIAAFRYALGRMSYIVGHVADWLVANTLAIPANTKAQIVKEIDEAARRDGLGMECDVRSWMRVRKAFDPQTAGAAS